MRAWFVRAPLNGPWTAAPRFRGQSDGRRLSATGSRYMRYGPPCRSRSWVRQTIGSQSPSPWRSQPCHAFTEPGGYTRSQEDTKKIQFEYRRNRADTTEHERTPHLFEAGCDFLNLTPPRSLWPARERRAGQQ